MARVTLIGKPGCHLCDVAQEVVERVCAEAGADWEKRSVADDETLHRRYWDKIPVILVDGRQVAVYEISDDALHRALTGAATRRPVLARWRRRGSDG